MMSMIYLKLIMNLHLQVVGLITIINYKYKVITEDLPNLSYNQQKDLVAVAEAEDLVDLAVNLQTSILICKVKVVLIS